MTSSNAYPRLPGYIPQHDPTANRPIPEYILPHRERAEEPDQSRMLAAPWKSTTHSMHPPLNAAETSTQYEPSFVKLSRHVLRFTGYFKESVIESAVEHYKVRKLIVYYYLEDHTLSIIEPRIMNSGTPQGTFLKRQSVLKDDHSGMALVPGNFSVGEDVLIYGKHIKLVDCDEYTREFYQLNGRPQGRPEGIPEDPYTQQSRKVPVKSRDQAMNEFLEKSLGGGRPKNEKQFLDNDRRVLRFYCKSVENYVLHYYLADDTVEILESHFPNDGKVEFPILLKRNKLPKKLVTGQPGSRSSEEDFLREHEIEPNMTLSVFGRGFVVVGADAFTADYYRQHYARVFSVGPSETPAPLEASNVVIPPHNGIGSEEDSLGYIYRLQPKQPYKDYFKFIDNSHKILRWVAKFNSPQPEDVDRRFVIGFYLNDDTVQINEMPQRNSGIQEGKFLTRGRYRNPYKSNEYFAPSDLLVNSNVVINRYNFHVESCDEYTRKWMDANCGIH